MTSDPNNEIWQTHIKCLNTRQSFRDLIYSIESADGPRQWVSTSGRPIYDSAGRFQGYRGTGKEVTNQVEAEMRAKRAEEELRKSQEIMRALADNLPEFVTLKDLQGRFLFVNKRFEEWVCLKRSEVLGKTVFDIYSPNQAEEFDALDRHAIDAQSVQSSELDLSYPDGNTRTVISTRFPINSSYGEVIGLGTVNVDFTDLKRAEQIITDNEKVIRDVLENVSQGVVMFDADKNLLAWNQQFQEILRHSEDMLIVGRPIREMILETAARGRYGDGNVEDITDERINILWGEDAARTDIIFRNARTYDVIAQQTQNGGLVITYSDITARKLAEEEIETQRDELEKMNEQKDKFFSIIAHDLKGPFNALLGYSSILETMAKTSDAESVIEYAATVHESGKRVFELLENLLDWSRLQMGKMDIDLAPVELVKMLGGNIALFTQIAEEKGVQLIDDGRQPLLALADDAMLDTTLRNLIVNAIKFTKPGGTVTVKTAQYDDWIDIDVVDTGVGMSPNKVDRLFQLDQKTSTVGTAGEIGTGLGLHLCKELTEKQNGKIDVNSIEGQGTTFTISLPKAPD